MTTKNELIAMLNVAPGNPEVVVADRSNTYGYIIDKDLRDDGKLVLVIAGPDDEDVEFSFESIR